MDDINALVAPRPAPRQSVVPSRTQQPAPARPATAKRIIAGGAVALAVSASLLVAPSASAAPVEDMGCGQVLWAKDNIFDHPSGFSPSGNVARYKGCLVKRGWASKVYRSMKDRQWRLNQKLSTSPCTADGPTPYLSGVTRTKYKGIRVVVFKYRFGWLTAC